MSKRGADEYITKEHGSISNVSEDSKVKMATAAQLAKRKMAAPKGRLNRGGTPTGSSQSTPTGSNPFVSSFGGSAPQPQQNFTNPGGIVFGESKSFPPGGSTSSNGFNFSMASSNSFTFGHESNAPNNPFANSNGNMPQQNSEPSEDAMMESPQKKTLTSSAFGSGTSGVSNGVGFSGFGQNTQQGQLPQSPLFGAFGQSHKNETEISKPNGSFGQSLNTPTSNPFSNGGFSFGQPSATNQTNPSALPTFGQSQGQSSSPSTTPTFTFGQASESPAKTTAPQSTFQFGQSTQPKEPKEPESQGTPPLFNFNPASQQKQPETQKSTPLFNFGQTSQSSLPSFGTASSAPQAPGATSFGASQPNSASSNPFAGLNKTNQTEQNPAPLFGSSGQSAKLSTDKSATSNTNLFSGFGEKNNTTNSSTAPTASPVSNENSKPLFGFGTPSNSSTLFGSTRSGTGDAQTKSPPKPSSKPLFDFGSAPAKSPSDMFSPPTTTTETGPTFPSKQVEHPVTQPSSAQKTPPFSFGQSATKVSHPQTSTFQFGTKQTEPKSTFSQLTNEVTTPTPINDQSAPVESPPAGVIDGSASLDPSRKTNAITELFPTLSKSAGQVSLPKNSERDQGSEQSTPKRSIYTNPPARIPAYLDAEKYKSYDSNYRLHSLNREFQKRIMSLDPSKDDFENIMRSYVAARESIGDSIGLYTRNTAGMKRKNDESDSQHEQCSTIKKARQTEESTKEVSSTKSHSFSSAFQPLSSTPKSAADKNVFASLSASLQSKQSQAPAPSNVTTSTLFKTMIPESNKSTVSKQNSANNIFANLGAASSTPSASGTPSKASLLFGNHSNSTKVAGSTTPPSSPPKQPASRETSQAPKFELPRFVAPATGADFMGAFAKKSQEASAKLAKELKEKRKLDEFDSDEDDEAEWEKKYEEEEKAKRAKLGQPTQKGFVPSFAVTKPSQVASGNIDPPPTSTTDVGPSESEASNDEAEDAGSQDNDDDDDDAENDDDLPEDEVDLENESQEDETEIGGIQNGKSLFDRITRDSDPKTQETQETPASTTDRPSSTFGASVFGNHFSQSTPEPPSFSPITPSTNQTVKPSTTFKFTPLLKESPAPSPGASVFNGGALRNGPVPGEGLFGSRTSSPVNGEKPNSSTLGNSTFGNFGSSTTSYGVDQTWKRGSGIKFGTSEAEPPAVNITAPSPRGKESFKPFSTLFGATATSSPNGSTSNSLGFNFAGPGSTPAPGFLGAASHLAPSSVTSSGMSSRATSPGGTDNESVATDTEDAQDDPQASLMELRPGEENENILFEARARALRFYSEAEKENTGKSTWNSEGLGPVRILQNRETKRSRIVLRADPGADIILNTNLLPDVDYVAKTLQNNTGGVNMIVSKNGKLESWMIKVKTRTIADEMVAIMEKAKKPQST